MNEMEAKDMTQQAAVATETIKGKTFEEEMKAKYGTLYEIGVTVDADDETEGRAITFLFRKPNVAAFNRYLKNAKKNMTASTTVFTTDCIIEEQAEQYKAECDRYPGLALNMGSKLLETIGMGDAVNFRRI